MKYKRFTKTKFLTEIGRELLAKFFERFQNELEKASVTLPGTELADDPYYSAVARVLLAPEDLPVEMSEVLFAIDALSSDAGEDQLMAAMKKENPHLMFATKSSRADMAVQVWLARPELLARVYNEARLIRVSAFEFHGTPAPMVRRKTFTLPDKARHAALVKAVPDTGRVTRAKFEFLFEGETKPQTVTVKPVNELKVARHCDARLVHRWLSARGFCIAKTPPPANGESE